MRRDMMNLQAVNAAAPDALVSVTLSNGSPDRLPFSGVGSCSPTAPEVGLLSPLRDRAKKVAAIPTAHTLLRFNAGDKRTIASGAGAILGGCVTPPMREIASVRAIPLDVSTARPDADKLAAINARLVSAFLAPFGTIADGRERPTAATTRLRKANSHPLNIAAWRLNPEYAAMSERRIHDDAPLFSGASV